MEAQGCLLPHFYQQWGPKPGESWVAWRGWFWVKDKCMGPYVGPHKTSGAQPLMMRPQSRELPLFPEERGLPTYVLGLRSPSRGSWPTKSQVLGDPCVPQLELETTIRKTSISIPWVLFKVLKGLINPLLPKYGMSHWEFNFFKGKPVGKGSWEIRKVL